VDIHTNITLKKTPGCQDVGEGGGGGGKDIEESKKNVGKGDSEGKKDIV
jgi:hypothetical protein